MNAYLIHRAKGFYALASKSDGSMMQEEAAVISHAFACELALKGLIDTPKSGHDLLELFEEIPENIKD